MNAARLFHRDERKIVAVIALLAVAIHMLLLEAPIVIGEPYFVAQSLVSGSGFASIYPFAESPRIHNYIPALYPTFLSWLLLAGATIKTIQVIQLLMLGISYFPLYFGFRSFLSRSGATAGLLFLTVWLPIWRLAGCIDPNALNVLLLSFTFYTAIQFNSQGFRSTLLVGLLIGVQLLLRPDVLILLPFLVYWLFRYRGARLGKIVSIWASVFLLITLPVALRNFHQFGGYYPLSSNGGYNLFVGNHPNATGEYEQLASDTGKYKDLHALASTISQPAFDNALRKRAITWIIDHPASAVSLALTKAWYHWWIEPSSGRALGNGWMATCYFLALTLMLLSSIAVLFGLRDRAARALILSLFVYSTLVACIFFVQTRHRILKIDPILLMLAGQAAVSLISILKRKWSRILALDSA